MNDLGKMIKYTAIPYGIAVSYFVKVHIYIGAYYYSEIRIYIYKYDILLIDQNKNILMIPKEEDRKGQHYENNIKHYQGNKKSSR